MVTRMIRIILVTLSLLGLLLLSACVSQKALKDGPPKYDIDVSRIPDAVPKPVAKSRYGNPSSYVVYGKRYRVLSSAKGYQQRGIASWYGTKFHGQLTSSREPYNLYSMTAASPVLPIPCYVRVHNLENGRNVVVKVNDRGPFAPNRIIDLSYAAAKKLGYANKGTALVEVSTVLPGESPVPLLAARREKEHSRLPQSPHLYLQLGAFGQYPKAQLLKTRLAQITQRPVRITKTKHSNASLYKVQIGPLVGVGETDRLKRVLEHQGLGEAITVIG